MVFFCWKGVISESPCLVFFMFAKKKAHPLFQAYLKEAHDWQPEDSTSFTALHVAHLLCALNKLKRSGLREPDVDAHVEILQTLADNYLVQGKMIPAKLLRLGTLKHPIVLRWLNLGFFEIRS